MKKMKALSNAEITTLCGQLSLLINAGITPVESIQILLKDIDNAKGKELLEAILSNTSDGLSFAEALDKTSTFPSYFIHMISLGEESGNLDVVLNNLSEYYEHEDNIASSVRSALRYPLIMLVMMSIVIAVLLTKVLPIFQQVFSQLGSELTGLARRFMTIGNLLNQFSVAVLIIIFILFILYFIMSNTKKGQDIFNHFLTYSPFTKKFYLNVAYGRFASGLAMALSSGLDTFHSLDLVSNLIDNTIMKEKIEACRRSLQNDAGFPEALKEAGIFSNLYLQMISVGFRTGNIDEVMSKISTQYDENTEEKLHAFLTSLEPTLVIIFSFVVGLILLSVIMPLIGIMSSIS